MENRFVAGQAMLKAKSGKVVKHEKVCADNQYVSILFAFDTVGSLAPEAVGFLDRVQRVVHNHFSTARNQSFVFGRIGFATQKGGCSAACCPFTSGWSRRFITLFHVMTSLKFGCNHPIALRWAHEGVPLKEQPLMVKLVSIEEVCRTTVRCRPSRERNAAQFLFS
ncbi:hypothetical protein HanXRQr2_Chr15g0707111 [Helianthus annuus]|nr:hypothetical protein HanXRQr2_Chr15g0707111 [Helianthus annuus]KAJ0832424.1 hypothetical protein HanPSC8_Chr15g0678631 [Helianthus annuus]